VKTLGRGLAALIPDTALDTGAPARERPTLRLVPIDEIRANPHQPREVFDPAELTALSESIRAHGILSPLLCRREEGRYVLIAGERRLRAAALAGLTEVPVVLKEADANLEDEDILNMVNSGAVGVPIRRPTAAAARANGPRRS